MSKTKRPDISKYLIHLTRGNTEIAYQNLKSIIQKKLLNKTEYNIGGEQVVCFTETPIGCIKTARGLKNYTNQLCDINCEIDIDDCPPPEEFDKSLICVDGTC